MHSMSHCEEYQHKLLQLFWLLITDSNNIRSQIQYDKHQIYESMLFLKDVK